MSETPPRRPWLPPQQEALPRYLDALLRETWEAPGETFEPVDLIAPAEASDPTPHPGVTPSCHEASTDPVPPVDLDPRSAWGAAPFSAQLFQVDGLTLALPVSALVAIVDSADLVPREAGNPAWLRGRLCYPYGEIRVADTAHWVLPPDRPWSPSSRHYPVLVIAGGRWGLACDRVGEVVTLDPGAVHWRTARTQRRWLAGMVRQPACALLDPARFALLFMEALGDVPSS